MLHKSICLASTLAFAAVMTTLPAQAQTAGCTASGVLPPAFPTHMLIGINSGSPDDTWAKTSGTKWDVQWMYLTGQAGNNWYNDYGFGAADGSWIDGAFSTIRAVWEAFFSLAKAFTVEERAKLSAANAIRHYRLAI